MSSSFLYLAVDLACIAVPLLFSFGNKLSFYTKWKAFIPANLITLAAFVVWDMWFTDKGIWGFNEAYLTGIDIGNLPLEEWLFFICIPYACVFTYEALRYTFKTEPFRRLSIVTNVVFAAFCLLVVLMVPDRWYPFYTAVFALLFLIVLFKWKDMRITGWFILMYVIILVPFIISNGVLTGLDFWKYSLLNTHPESVSDQIVWYNNSHNLRIRIFSMPIDDLLYGWFMLYMNVSLYELFLKRGRKKGVV